MPGCHTRRLDAPAPKGGRIVCHACGDRVEFVELPSGPHWRCLKEKRHRQRVVTGHLKLPKMRDLVQQTVGVRGLTTLEKQLAGGQPRQPGADVPAPPAPGSSGAGQAKLFS